MRPPEGLKKTDTAMSTFTLDIGGVCYIKTCAKHFCLDKIDMALKKTRDLHKHLHVQFVYVFTFTLQNYIKLHIYIRMKHHQKPCSFPSRKVMVMTFPGEEPDLPELLGSLRAMNAQALREAGIIFSDKTRSFSFRVIPVLFKTVVQVSFYTKKDPLVMQHLLTSGLSKD